MRPFYQEKIGEDIIAVRNELMNVLLQEDEIQSILMLVGKDALSDEQRNILDVSELIRVGFLQQNAYNDTDKYVPLEKQIKMLNTIRNYYYRSAEAIKNGVPYNKLYDPELINDITQMKYNIKNDELDKFTVLNSKLESHFLGLKGGEY